LDILLARFASAEDFLSRLDVGGDAATGHITVPTKARYKENENVVLEVEFPGLPNRVLLRSKACAAVEAANGDGATFSIVEGEEHKRDFLVAVAAGRAAASWTRKNRRFPMRLPARFVVEGEDQAAGVPLRGDAETEDVSGGGVFLKTARSLPEGARVTIVLDPCDGSAEMEFTGRVVFTRRETGEQGTGIQFDRLNSDDMKRLRRLIRDVKLRGKMVEWEDASTL
jgi:Tfp pilus assembly protein PilZ